MRIKYSLHVLTVATALSLTGCQAIMQEKGNILKPEEVARIQEKKTTREEVFQLLGSPAFVNTFQPNRWIYIHDRRFEGFRMVNRLEITFDDKGVVQHIQRNFDTKMKDPRDLAGYDENTPWYLRWKVGKPHDETKLAMPMPQEERSWWKFWGDKKKPAPLLAQPGPASKDPLDVLPPKQSLWDRLTDFTIQTRQPVQPEPDTALAPGEENWWREMFEKDPTQGGEPGSVPVPGGGGDTAREILEGPSPTPAPTAPKVAPKVAPKSAPSATPAPAPTAPKASAPPPPAPDKPWWKVW